MTMNVMMRKKKYRFSVEVRVEELQHVPFLNQVLFAKVRLLDGGFTDHSPRVMVQEYAVRWNTNFRFTCKMTANASTGELDSCICRVSVRQEVRGGKSFQKLGYADINLAEFAGSGGMKMYLLEAYDSKHRLHNSMLKVAVDMVLQSGDPCFKAQPSRVQRYQSNEMAAEEPLNRHSSGSRVSLTSSGYDSLTKKVKEVIGDSEEMLEGTTEVPGHSRNSSNTSHGSGYASINSQSHTSQTSDKSGHIRNSSEGSGLSEGSLERGSRAKNTSGEGNKELRVDATRVDPDDFINQLLQDTKIEPMRHDDSAETSGLQLYIGKDGSTALGGHHLKSSGEFKAVVIDKR